MKKTLFACVLSSFVGLSVYAASKAPSVPKPQLKTEEQLKDCQNVINAASDTSKVAECYFYLGEQKYAAFSKLTLPTSYDKDKLASWMNDAKKTREEASELYIKVKGDPAWEAAALSRIGVMSYQFATSVRSAPLPDYVEYDLDGDGKLELMKLEGDLKKQVEEAVKKQLNEMAEPIEADAKTSFQLCVDNAAATSTKNSWTKLCAEFVALLTPAKAKEKSSK